MEFGSMCFNFTIYLFIYLFVCLFVCLFVYLYIAPNGLDNSRQITILKKWTTLSLKQDMFRSLNDHLRL